MIINNDNGTRTGSTIANIDTDIKKHAMAADGFTGSPALDFTGADFCKSNIADKFIIRRKLGPVILAEDRQTGKPCLIRPLSDFSQPDVAGLLKLIRHPGIPQIYDIWTPDQSDDSLPQSLVFYEYIPGLSLREKINQRASHRKIKTAIQRKQTKQLLQWLLQGAGILSFLHCQQNRALLHLDIKPENIIINDMNRLTLIDFSVSRFDLPEFDLPAFDLAREDNLSFTPAYAAPELLNGKPCTASDVFSLALSMLEWISGTAVTACRNQTTIILKQALPEICHDLFTACLSPDPAERPDTAGELTELIQQRLHMLSRPDKHDTWPLKTKKEQQKKQKQDEKKDTEPAGGKKLSFLLKQQLSEKVRLPDKQSVVSSIDNTSSLAPRQHLPKRLTVFGDAAFGCELACVMAASGPVLVIEADWFNPHSDQLLSLDKDKDWLAAQNKTAGLDQALSDIRNGQLNAERLRALCETGAQKEIWVLTPKRDLHYYEQYRGEDFQILISIASQVFPTTIILVNAFIYDLYTCLGLMMSDQVLIPVKGSKTALQARQRAISFLRQKSVLTHDNLFYVAYPYEKEYDLSWHSMQAITHSRMLGLIGENKERRLLRNEHNSYCHVISKKNQTEYLKLLKKLEDASSITVQAKVVE